MTTDGQIRICDKREPSDGKIRICDKREPSDGKIRICNECGPGLSTLTISGPEAPVVGSTYSAGGGKGPYSFSISSGAIDGETGQVTNLSGACGTGSVTVTDACGGSASMAVRFPVGQWVLVYEGIPSPPPSWNNQLRQTVVEGGSRYERHYAQNGYEVSALAFGAGQCTHHPYSSSYEPGSVLAAKNAICGHAPSLPFYGDLPGTWDHSSGVYEPVWAVYYQGNYSYMFGWLAFYYTGLYNKYAWECP